LPVVEGRVVQVRPKTPPPAAAPQPPARETNPEAEEAKRDAEEERKNNPIQRLIALQDADIKAWMEEVMPEGTRCIFVAGLQVAPKHQRRGVGSALLRFGTNFCDDKGVFAWVHSSESAWKAYEKCGFQVTRSQDCDLDAYAPMPPPGEGPDAKWGNYVLRYMKYFPKVL
jgi:GNAT superfamily N-acetyltransferase